MKIRGYRIELTEIESVLLELPQVAQAAVITHEAEPGLIELAAYYSLKQGVSELPRNDISQALRSRLPAYMVPAYLEQLPLIPMTVSNKADHKKLPKPKGPRFVAVSGTYVAPCGATEELLARELSEVLKVERVSAEDNFFKDLGAHSLLMARFCARIRQHPGLSAVSMRDIYLNPTVAKLAAHLGAAAAAETVVPTRELPFRIPSNLEYYGCGALQLMFYLGYGLFALSVLVAGFEWTYAAVDNIAELYLRIVAFLLGTFVLFNVIPIAAKWLLIGRWKEEAIPVWSLRYFRFWVVKTLVQSAPLAGFAGTPLYNVYLRLFGAKIGRNTVIAARFAPVCTDLFSVGDNTLLRKDSILLGYKAQGNYIHTGSITIGDNAFVGEASVVDIDTVIGNDGQLAHSSSLLQGQRVPDGKRYHGTPAQETPTNFRLRRKPALHPAAARALLRLSARSGLRALGAARGHDPLSRVPVFLSLHERPAARLRGPGTRPCWLLRWKCCRSPRPYSSARCCSGSSAWPSFPGCSISSFGRARLIRSTACTTCCRRWSLAPAICRCSTSCSETAPTSSTT